MSNVSPPYGYVVCIFCKFVKTRKNAMQCRAVTRPTPRDLHILCSAATESLDDYCLRLLLAAEMSKRPPYSSGAIGVGDSRSRNLRGCDVVLGNPVRGTVTWKIRRPAARSPPRRPRGSSPEPSSIPPPSLRPSCWPRPCPRSSCRLVDGRRCRRPGHPAAPAPYPPLEHAKRTEPRVTRDSGCEKKKIHPMFTPPGSNRAIRF